MRYQANTFLSGEERVDFAKQCSDSLKLPQFAAGLPPERRDVLMDEQQFPIGWDEQRVERLSAELDARADAEWIAADEAAARKSEREELSVVAVDFRRDAVSIRTLLKDAVRDYCAKNHPAVTRIDLAFSLGDGESTPWVHLHFDTKAGGEPDGDPTYRGLCAA